MDGKQIVIHCKTKEQYDDTSRRLNRIWTNPLGGWNSYGDRVCIMTKENLYGSLGYFQRNSDEYEIVSYDEYFTDNAKSLIEDLIRIKI